ncbi:ectoine/hydroxyectoine ABC transporter substrate-binding protein EhuB [Bradyrhizobium manausense]|uniref:Solute-binding protein family 3/N-terminal domain-containing protein n=1 Tax=Bradyrhizobium manausense TaxID=989370 RepID=A0A0R3DSU5_9BRAD|nr:ectoine/hydroxyectoine ABC transporter substrate-binding protein EhuB [Bradyrhizobium manausense]KRQ10932.1 hypothetical protein AOQ71_18625 [Bradyrhizobium manausense]
MVYARKLRSSRLARIAATFPTLLVGLTASINASSALAESLENVKANGAIIAIANEPPWMRIDENGSPAGLGPEIDEAILKEAGITKVTGQLMEYGAMIPALQSGRATMSSSQGLYIKPERCEAVLFSDPVTCGGEGFILPIALGSKVKTYKDVADQSLRIGLAGGTTEQKLAIEAGVKDENIVIFPDGTTGMKLLLDKRIDVFALDSGASADLQKRLGNPAVTQFVRVEGVKPSCGGAAFSKDNAELRDAYNRGLAKIKASGKFYEIYKKYGSESYMGTDDITTKQLCTK